MPCLHHNFTYYHGNSAPIRIISLESHRSEGTCIYLRDITLLWFNSGPKNSKEKKKLLVALGSVCVLWMRKHYGNGNSWINHKLLTEAVNLACQSPEVGGMWEQQVGMLTSQPYGSGLAVSELVTTAVIVTGQSPWKVCNQCKDHLKICADKLVASM